MLRLLTCCAALAVAAAQGVVLPNPALVWSGAGRLVGKNSYAVGDVAQADLQEWLLSLIARANDAAAVGATELAALREGSAPAAALVGFIYDDGECLAADLSRDSMDRAKSSAVVPFVYSSRGAESWASVRDAAGLELDLRVETPEGAGPAIDAALAAEGAVLLIRVSDAAAVAKVCEAVEEATGGNYVAFLSGLAPPTVPAEAVRSAARQPRLLMEAEQLANNGTKGAEATVVNPSSIAGMVTSLLLFLLLALYLGCIAEVQVPSKFVTRIPAMGKEFTGE